jgi:hypothetical protein
MLGLHLELLMALSEESTTGLVSWPQSAAHLPSTWFNLQRRSPSVADYATMRPIRAGLSLRGQSESVVLGQRPAPAALQEATRRPTEAIAEKRVPSGAAFDAVKRCSHGQ